MHLLRESGQALVVDLARQLSSVTNVDVAVCPPMLYLEAIGESLQGSKIGLGAQNMFYEVQGAFTGEVSGPMLKDMGCDYVILGHSERRQFFGETDESVNRKMFAAMGSGLCPIVCVGETLDQRESGQTAQVIETQVRGSLSGLTADDAARVVVAYEPVWAIGTGRTATPQQAEEVHAQIRQLLKQLLGAEASQVVRIQYGGSVKPENAAELMGQPNIDGALVGGASLQAESFAKICLACC